MADIRQFVSFILGEARFAMNIMDIEEIIRMMDITPVPKAPGFVEGIINLRGRVIPVIDLRERLNVPSGEDTEDNRIIVVNLKGRRVGFVVDNVEQVIRLTPDTIDKAPAMGTGINNAYIEGVARSPDLGMIIILDIKSLFSSGEQQALSRF